MLVITEEQMKKLAESVRKNQYSELKVSLVDHIESAYPEMVWNKSKDDQYLRIQKSMDKAIDYDAVSEQDIIIFVELTFELGLEFDIDPAHEWTHQILADDTLDISSKLKKLRRVLNDFDTDGSII